MPEGMITDEAPDSGGRRSEQRRMWELIESLADAVVVINLRGEVIYANPAAETLFGRGVESLCGQPFGFPASGGECTDVQVIRPSGICYAEMRVVQSQWDGQEVRIACMRDITERKQAEERISHLNKVLKAIRDINQLIVREKDRDALIDEGCRLMVENRSYASCMIVLTDENERPVSWARGGLADASEPLGKMIEGGVLPSCFRLAQRNQKVMVIQKQQTVCGECPISEICFENLSLCTPLMHDGVRFGYLAVAVEKRLAEDDEERELLNEMAGDLAYALYFQKMEQDRRKSETRRISLEAQLIQAQKLESVGRLAGGVAHDFNNMISVITGYAEMVMQQLGKDHSVYGDLNEIITAAHRSANITRQLLAFARKQTISPKVLDLNETVGDLLKMLKRLIGEDIDLAWQPSQDLWPLIVDPSQVDQILANLCVNARDAITGVGKITIETGNVTFDEGYCQDHAGFVPGDYVLLAVSDNGYGMSREVLGLIFEPFFTTKEEGRGTGLGLATVYGIIRQNNGFVNVYSELGHGTTFKIYIPRYFGDARPGAPMRRQTQIQANRGETVLVVEDDPTLLRLTQKMLEKLNYTVLAADNHGTATALAQQHPGKIHLLISDVIMPEMNGRDLADRLLAVRPEMKVLFMSGYTANVIAHHGVLKEGVNFIQKPFSMEELGRRMREVLDAG